MGAHVTPEKKLAVLQDIMAGQDIRKVIAAKNNVSVSTVDRMRDLYKKKYRNGTTLSQLAGITNHANGEAPIRTKNQAKTDKLTEAIHALKANGMKTRDIAERLSISYGTVNYHLHIRKQPTTQAILVRDPENQNGGLRGINKYVYVGIYVAESERLGNHIAERFGLSSDFLRSGLSEFLEHTKVRRTPRIQD